VALCREAKQKLKNFCVDLTGQISTHLGIGVLAHMIIVPSLVSVSSKTSDSRGPIWDFALGKEVVLTAVLALPYYIRVYNLIRDIAVTSCTLHPLYDRRDVML
jgi:hypothetical protein